MKLAEVLHTVAVQGSVPEIDVDSLSFDSRVTGEGSLFFCIAGTRSDGHEHAAAALGKGAAAVVCQRDLGLDRQILVADTRKALGVAAANFFGRPADRLTLLGVTGTNGKTSITYLMKHILEKAGHRVGLIGTIHNEIDDVTLPARYTTPDPVQLHAILARIRDAGCTHAVMEVSSHALDQERVEGLRFAAAAFTNLTQDHLDYHGDMQRYFVAKRKLFEQCDTAVLNADDEYGRLLPDMLSCPCISFTSTGSGADYTAHDVQFTARGTRFALMAGDKIYIVRLPIPGYFTVSNAMAAIGCCVAAGVPIEQAVAALADCPGIPGRIELLPTDTPFTVIRDYAHAPDALQKILETVRKFAPARVVCLFGCAGNRDRAKRPLMAEIVARLADFVVLTSDNPRDEDPRCIIDDALPGLKRHRTPYEVIADRYSAIEWVLKTARDDDVIVLAGKGHENYQVLDYGTIHFDEKEIVTRLLANAQGGAR